MSTLRWRVSGNPAGMAGICVGALVSVLAGCGDLCGNQTLSEHVSPDGRWKVVVFERDCGTTTGFSTQASVVRADASLPEEAGNAFTADAGHGNAPDGHGGGPELRVKWETPTRVVLSYHPGARVFLANRNVNGIEIQYGTLE